MTNENNSISLIKLNEKDIKDELNLTAKYKDSNDDLKIHADSSVKRLLSVDIENRTAKENSIVAIETIGDELQEKASRRSGMLKQSIHTLSKTGDDGGPVATSLVELRSQVESLDPSRIDFSMSTLRRLISFIPFVGSPMNKYFSRYQSAGSVITSIIDSLEKGRDQLKRDNITLLDDQEYMYDLMIQLKKTISFAEMIDDGLTYNVENELTSDDPKGAFIKEEIQFPLRQKIVDLQQQLAVAQQGVLTIELIKRNNKELIRGVKRATGVTVNALQVAISLSLALANQKIVLDKIEKINTVTDNMIASTSEKLKIQGVAIHKQASSAQLSMETLKKSFQDIHDAFEDISKFRQDALPIMASNILEMDTFSAKAEDTIEKMNKGQVISNEFSFDLESL